MRILVQVTDTASLRHFSTVIRSLARRGHTVRIAAVERRADVPVPAALARVSGVTFIGCPEHRGDALGKRIAEIRALRDYVRYAGDPFKRAAKLRARALRKLVKALSGGHQSSLGGRCPHCSGDLSGEHVAGLLLERPTMARIESLLALVEDTIPSDRSIEAFLREENPDLLLVTPLVRIGSHQSDYVKSARALGIPVAFPVFSWDNLSTKGLIHVIPDWVLVWNEWQRTEAVEMHRVPADRVVVTGAPRFDPFFAMKPKVPRERLCRKLRFDPEQPIITYLCSSRFVAGREREFVVRWVEEVRRLPELAACNIIVRPHPRQADQWKKFKRPAERVAVTFPRSISVDQSLYDTLHHSAAVVGLNTSAQLEAGIVGRPVLTILAPEFEGGQQGTVHFHYLVKERGGFVEVASDFDTHGRQLVAAVSGKYDRLALRAAVERFVRPHGIERRATPVMVEAIERIAATGRRRTAFVSGRPWHDVRARLAALRRAMHS